MSKPIFEAEVIRGLERFGMAEAKKAGGRLLPVDSTDGFFRFQFGKSRTRLEILRIVNQLFQVHLFDVPRPKALLGQQHFDRIRQLLKEAVNYLGAKNLQAFRLEAAGRDSAVFQRLISQIEAELNLPHDPEAGDLFLRVKPAAHSKGWELLVRQSVRPLATRAWRKFNYPGAISAPVAAVMLQLAQIQPDADVLNVMCGSGTLLAENSGHLGMMTGVDLNQDALDGARLNLQAAGVRAELLHEDAAKLPFEDESFEVILADLPWGQLIGEMQAVRELYPAVVGEAWRVAKPGGRFVVITQLKKQMHQAISKSGWTLIEQIPLKMDRVNPDIYLLQK